MREIKFRAWDNEIREFLSGDYEPISVGDSKVVTGGDWQGVYYTDKYTIEQYTGLKDKNGKEIYEGDILQDESNDTAVVIWREHHAEWGIKWMHMGIEDSLSHRMEWGHLNEIIGNIHENTELLEDKNGR